MVCSVSPTISAVSFTEYNYFSSSKALDFELLEGVTVIVSTHDTDVLEQFSERVIELKDGKIIKDTKAV